jgi:hypothetical protein
VSTRLHRLYGALAIVLLLGLLAVPLDAAAKPKKHRNEQPRITLHAASVTGQVQGGGTFAGALDLTELGLEHSQLVAAGAVTGTLTDAAGTAQSIIEEFQLPLQITGCQAPTVTLTFLEALGVDTPESDRLVDLNPGVSATITASNGADTNAVALLGALLCQVSDLQRSPDLLESVLDIINAVL